MDKYLTINGKQYTIPVKEREAFTFYRSFLNTIESDDISTAEERNNLLMGIIRYALLMEKPNIDKFGKVGRIIWTAIEPNITSGIVGFVNGLKSAENTGKAPKAPKTPKTEKDKYGDCVYLTKNEYAKLVAEYGEPGTLWMIKKLDNWKASTGKTYQSDYKAVLSWVVEEYKKQAPKINLNANKATEKAEKAERERIQSIHDEEVNDFRRTLNKYGLSAREYLQFSDLFDGTKSEAEIMEAINEARQRQTKIV